MLGDDFQLMFSAQVSTVFKYHSLTSINNYFFFQCFNGLMHRHHLKQVMKMMQIYCHAFKFLTSFSIKHSAFDPQIVYDHILDLLSIMYDVQGFQHHETYLTVHCLQIQSCVPTLRSCNIAAFRANSFVHISVLLTGSRGRVFQ